MTGDAAEPGAAVLEHHPRPRRDDTGAERLVDALDQRDRHAVSVHHAEIGGAAARQAGPEIERRIRPHERAARGQPLVGEEHRVAAGRRARTRRRRRTRASSPRSRSAAPARDRRTAPARAAPQRPGRSAAARTPRRRGSSCAAARPTRRRGRGDRPRRASTQPRSPPRPRPRRAHPAPPSRSSAGWRRARAARSARRRRAPATGRVLPAPTCRRSAPCRRCRRGRPRRPGATARSRLKRPKCAARSAQSRTAPGTVTDRGPCILDGPAAEVGRRPAGAVDAVQRALVPDEREGVTADAVVGRLRDRQHRGGRERRVDRVPPALERAQAGAASRADGSSRPSPRR